MHHDLFEEIDWGCFDGPGEAELAQMGTGVARQGFACVKQLAAEITEDCWWGLYICGGLWEMVEVELRGYIQTLVYIHKLCNEKMQNISGV